ncbi:MAG TPA: sulfatase [Bryobacteraceae bacterium]|nr:sulfatase [Bryobacteraceae bacterium]
MSFETRPTRPSRRQALRLATGALAASARVSAAPRPNIVFILMDDLRWDELACAGHPFARTPNIDRLAREGVSFRNAFVTTPLCSPSRACFLTGQYAHTHGVIDNTDHSPLSHRLDTFPRHLEKAGYDNAFIGKWHMGVDDSARPGFRHWVSFKGQGTYFDPEMNVNGKSVKAKGYTTDILNGHAVEFLERKRTAPFFLYLSHKAVHPELDQAADGSVSDPAGGAFIPADRHKTLYAGQPVPRRLNAQGGPVGKPALLRKIGGLPPLSASTRTGDETMRNRLRMFASAEEGVGRILKVLEKSGQLDNTFFVFTSDEGYFYGEHGLSYERRLAYEESARIPLMIRYPALIQPGSVVDAMTLNIDMAPTLLEVAGADPLRKVHGRSFLPLLKGDTKGWRTSFLIERFSDKVFPRVADMGYQCVRNERWKYIRYTELSGMDELYDLRSDPCEMKNLIHERAARNTLAQLKVELDRLLRQSSGAAPALSGPG